MAHNCETYSKGICALSFVYDLDVVLNRIDCHSLQVLGLLARRDSQSISGTQWVMTGITNIKASQCSIPLGCQPKRTFIQETLGAYSTQSHGILVGGQWISSPLWILP